jgi:alginate O-acetyltransferase complex protein AlgI
MVFSNLTFVCLFLPVTLALYFSSPKWLHNTVLVFASIVFYIWGGRIAIVLVLVSIAVNFHLGQAIAASGPQRRDQLIRYSVAGNLFALIVFKYLDFVVDNFNVVLDAYWHWKIPSPHIPLPIGISFFTFHIISYLVDVYRGVAPPQRSPIPFALYIINFPQLIAGPIVRYRPISSQLTERSTTFADFEVGVVRFAVGLSKKLLIANPIGAVADHLFALAPSDLPIWGVWLAVVCYAIQIYFDFSGYSDMAIGMARMFGFRFPENFNYPHSAISIQDFWRRWHMTLSAWFRDYVYIPLGGSRGGFWPTARNLWIVFLLCGAWHGASWNFIIWGLWHGLFLSIERIEAVERLLARTPAALRNVYVLAVVLVGWVFFRSLTLDQAVDMLTRMFGLQQGSETMLSLASNVAAPTMVLIGVAVCLSYPVWPFARNAFERTRRGTGQHIVYGVVRAGFIGAITLLCIATMTVDQNNPFIYFRF